MSLTDFLKSIADAIRNKTNTTGEIPASEFAERIEAIETGMDTSDATAAAEHIQKGKTAYAANTKITGTLEPAPGDIKTGVTIAGVEGTFTVDGNIAAGEVLSGKIGYAKGSKVTGTMANNGAVTKSFTPSTSSQSYTIPAGYHDGKGTIMVKSVATATQATPSISVSSAGLITASATQTAGYVAAGTKSATSQLSTQAAATITPGTSSKTAVAAGKYTTGAVTVAGSSNLVAGNIKSGVNIFGVTGTLSSGPALATITINFNYTSGYHVYCLNPADGKPIRLNGRGLNQATVQTYVGSWLFILAAEGGDEIDVTAATGGVGTHQYNYVTRYGSTTNRCEFLSFYIEGSGTLTLEYIG